MISTKKSGDFSQFFFIFFLNSEKKQRRIEQDLSRRHGNNQWINHGLWSCRRNFDRRGHVDKMSVVRLGLSFFGGNRKVTVWNSVAWYLECSLLARALPQAQNLIGEKFPRIFRERSDVYRGWRHYDESIFSEDEIIFCLPVQRKRKQISMNIKSEMYIFYHTSVHDFCQKFHAYWFHSSNFHH